MQNQQDRQAIDGLFDRIEDVARNSSARDRNAEGLIQQRLREFPPAPYYMAQTILIQEQALRQAQERIQQLEAQGSQTGGFLGGLFGDEQDRRAPRQRGPWGDPHPVTDNRRRDGGGFLAGAAQTALGVTGGMLLGSAIAGMFSGEANAGEVEPAADDVDVGGDDFGGGDFDIGGDF